MTAKFRKFLKAKALALLSVFAVLVFLIFTASPLGKEYGDAVDYYAGLVFLMFLAIVSLFRLQEWWTSQVNAESARGSRKTRSAKIMDWWRHWETDWDWKSKDNDKDKP
jgi:L-lactate permease